MDDRDALYVLVDQRVGVVSPALPLATVAHELVDRVRQNPSCRDDLRVEPARANAQADDHPVEI